MQIPVNKGGVKECWERWVDPLLKAGGEGEKARL